MEERQLMTATLQPISNVTVPAQQGYVVPLLASTTSPTPNDNQTFTVTSSNPDITASIAPSTFWTVGVNYTDSSDPTDNFTGTLVFNLFSQTGNPVQSATNLTPQTVNQIDTLSNSTTTTNFVNTYYYFNRIATGFPTAADYVVQGGSPTADGTETPSYPTIPNENVQQLAFTGTDQLAMANAGVNTGSTQFFVTTASPNAALGYGYTIFGQLLTGVNTLAQMTQVPVMTNTNTGEDSQPVNPLTITSTAITTANPNGALIINTTQATAGQTATITVTSTDPTDGSTASQSFTVTVGTYTGPTDPAINFRPFATAVTASASAGTPQTIQLTGKSGYPDSTTPGTLSYSLVSQPSDGTVSNFNSSTGTFTYTPNNNFTGTDTFQYEVTATGPESTPATTVSNPATVTVTVGPKILVPVDTGAVRIVGTSPNEVLIVTPPPSYHRHTKNTIDVSQVASASANGGSEIQVVVNGQLDENEPGIGDLTSIVVYGGSKVTNLINIENDVTVPATINGGYGHHNVLTGGGGSTREHGWFGHTTLVGGQGPNYLIGQAGHVRFKPSKATQLAFAGIPRRRTSHLSPVPPGGTLYTLKNGHLVAVDHYKT
jgi:cyclophilin family peptidyl-prolyl cis-trans isomerase